MSNQIVQTPVEFLRAVELRFGAITFDIAANRENNVYSRLNVDVKLPGMTYFGPGSAVAENAFLAKWQGLGRLAWLNPPFADIEPWAERASLACVHYRQRIAMLLPASICTSYFIKYVNPFAYRFELTPRVFKTEIRDCVLALYEPSRLTGIQTWDWKDEQ